MEKEFSLIMALVDYIPVILFLMAMTTIIKDINHKLGTISKVMLYFGIFLIVTAGGFKATYKLLHALKIGDFTWMSNQFFSNQAFGFLLAGAGLITTLYKAERTTAYALPIMALVGIMIFGLGAMDAGLCYISNKMKKRNALVCFIASFFLSIVMGYLSSKDFDKAFMNWIAQGVNILGQLLLYIGVTILHKAGLKQAISNITN